MNLIPSLIFHCGCLIILFGVVSCSTAKMGDSPHNTTRTFPTPFTSTFTPLTHPIISLSSPNPWPSPSPIPTSTPWPTVDSTLYYSLYTTPKFTFTPTPNYYAHMKALYSQMIGEWWGKMRITIKRQGREARYVVVVFNEKCEMGQICGRYHFDDGCFGELVLNNWRPTFLVFRNLEYSGKQSCKNWNPMNVEPLVNDRLSFTFSYRNEQGVKVNKGVVLRRK